ncbi:MAG: hypothetical protein HY077_10020 [Elusimicrobia bacterium]|nr:hypothetical protein [Elusimicrobiota bacterium]
MGNKAAPFDLFSDEFQRAVSKIQPRAELQVDDISRAITESFVDAGLLVQLQNTRRQIIMGRRGSGKSHLLLKLAESIQPGESCLYLNYQRLGSGPLVATESAELTANKLHHSICRRIEEFCLQDIYRRGTVSKDNKIKATGQLIKMADLSAADKYADYCKQFEDFLHLLSIPRFTLILDEWVAVPYLVQPYLAELIKRTFFHSPKIVIKIAAIGFQSRFGRATQHGASTIGFDVGADIAIDTDLDAYLVYDKETDKVEKFLAAVLFKHLESSYSLPKDDPHDWLIINCFTQREALSELVRACEGVPRDFLYIFSRAYFDALQTRRPIGVPHVRKATEGWYVQDKLKNVQDEPLLRDFLNTIVDEVIGKRKARTFLVEQRFSRARIILKLFDLRLLHIMKRGWSRKHKPGVRYDIFSIDYGAYVNLRNTANEPQIEFELFKPEDAQNEAEFIVPFDDFRRIRGIELPEGLLNTFETRYLQQIRPILTE